MQTPLEVLQASIILLCTLHIKMLRKSISLVSLTRVMKIVMKTDHQ